jgi:hypothetical protein
MCPKLTNKTKIDVDFREKERERDRERAREREQWTHARFCAIVQRPAAPCPDCASALQKTLSREMHRSSTRNVEKSFI